MRSKYTVTILGVQFPTTGKVLRAPLTEVVLAYTKAMREGEGEAKKVLKTTKARGAKDKR